MSGEVVGAVIGATAGLVFILVNSGSMPGALAPAVRILGGIAFLAILASLFMRSKGSRGRPMTPDPRARRVYWRSVAVEAILIPVGASAFTRLSHPELVVPWVALVVGAHFLPFARAFQVAGFRPLAWCLIGLAVIGGCLALTAGAAAGAAVAGVLSGVALLAFAVYLGRSGAPAPRLTPQAGR